jgi:hypothetical protein
MIQPKLLMAACILTTFATLACSDTTGPKQLGPAAPEFARSGTFRVVKNCSSYRGGEGESCTVTSSTLKQIEAGSIITYASGADLAGQLNSDVVLDPPGPGNNIAFGHCTIDLVQGTGQCEFSGGTGKFTWFEAQIEVLPLQPRGDLNFEWNGMYNFSPAE